MIAVCSLKEPIGFSTVGIDHLYDGLEVSKITNGGKAEMEFMDPVVPQNTITRPSEAKKKEKKKKLII